MASKSRINARRFLHSKEGNIAILTGLMLPAVVGFCGIATEVGYWYYRNRDIQAAADIASYNGAIVLRKGGSDDEVRAAATTAAAANGWRQADGTITVNMPPTSGTHQDELSVEVILNEDQERYFTRFFFGNEPAPIGARAVGTYHSDGQACFLALDKTKAAAMNFTGSMNANFQSCNVVSNSTNAGGFSVGGSAQVTVPCVQSAGGFALNRQPTLTSCTSPTANAEPTPDPYEDLPAPVFGGCSGRLLSAANTVQTITNPTGVRCFAGTDIRGTVNFEPGVYVISGPLATNDFTVQGQGRVNCNGCMFYFTNGANMNFAGNAIFNLTAMRPGLGPEPYATTYSGVLFYGDRTQPYGINIMRGAASSGFTGAVYFPSQEVQVTGNFSGAQGCMQLVANTITYTGSATFSSANCSQYGMQSVPTPGAVALAE